MFKYISSFMALFFLMNGTLQAWDDCDLCPENRLYIGVFGGEAFSDSTKFTQMGTAFFTEAEGGPLAVLAKGHAKKKTAGLWGVQAGYEWLQSANVCSNWNITPAAELEAYFFNNKRKGHFINNTDRLPEHDFLNSFNVHSSVILANAVLTLNSPCLCNFKPYVGGGIGAARVSLKNAKSLQLSPPEAGIDHFNSKRHDSNWTFAAQAKVGLRYEICDSFHIFGEYRYLYIDSSKYVLGSTVYPTHAPTSPWNVKADQMQYNAWVIGLQYDL